MPYTTHYHSSIDQFSLPPLQRLWLEFNNELKTTGDQSLIKPQSSSFHFLVRFTRNDPEDSWKWNDDNRITWFQVFPCISLLTETGKPEKKNTCYVLLIVAKQLYFTGVNVWNSAPKRQWSEPERQTIFFTGLPTQSCDITPWRREWSHMRKWKIKQIHAPTRESNTSLVVC